MTSKIVVNNIEADAGINTVTISGDVAGHQCNGKISRDNWNLTVYLHYYLMVLIN